MKQIVSRPAAEVSGYLPLVINYRIVNGGTRPFFYMMEQFVSMGVRDHFPILWLHWPSLMKGYPQGGSQT